MKKEVRTVVYDDDLHIEAYRFSPYSFPRGMLARFSAPFYAWKNAADFFQNLRRSPGRRKRAVSC